MKTRISWIVRPTTTEDEDVINRLFERSWNALLLEFYGREMLSKALPAFEAVRAKSLLTCGTYYVVQHPETQDVVGVGGWTWEHPIDTGTEYPHIRHVATDPTYLRQGIGRAIWNQCWSDIVKQSGSGKTTVEVLSTLPSSSFYENLGFERVKEVGVPLDETCNFPCLYMVRTVA